MAPSLDCLAFSGISVASSIPAVRKDTMQAAKIHAIMKPEQVNHKMQQHLRKTFT